jgi:predicted membrane-bound dolichyl-phosphate-mannose-protein mannosyltransferase
LATVDLKTGAAPEIRPEPALSSARVVWLTLLGVWAASFAMLYMRLQVVGQMFDEVDYVAAAKAILARSADPNPEHPMVAKIFIALGMRIFGDTPLGWRIASVLFGSLVVAGVYVWTLLLVRRNRTAIWAAALTLMNPLVFVMSRIAMLDIYVTAFVTWAFVALTAGLMGNWSRHTRVVLIASSGLLFGLALSSKWIALGGWAGAFAVLAIVWARSLAGKTDAPRFNFPVAIGALAVLPVLTYGTIEAFRKAWFHLPLSLASVVTRNEEVWHFHQHYNHLLQASIPWYTWPFRFLPEHFEFTSDRSVLIVSTPVLMAGFIAALACAWKAIRLSRLPELIVGLAFCGLYFQWAAATRGTFFYYYIVPSVVLGPALALWAPWLHKRRAFGMPLDTAILIVGILMFAILYPLMAAVPLPMKYIPQIH